MGGLISIGIFVIIYIFISRSAIKKSRRTSRYPSHRYPSHPEHENFPFPKLEEWERNISQSEDQSIITDEQAIDERYISAAADELQIDEVQPTTLSRIGVQTPIGHISDSNEITNPKAAEPKPQKKFNIREAVIYSEILKPKF